MPQFSGSDLSATFDFSIFFYRTPYYSKGLAASNPCKVNTESFDRRFLAKSGTQYIRPRRLILEDLNTYQQVESQLELFEYINKVFNWWRCGSHPQHTI
jgi:hypothetical protein